jgi:hypothetical protein
MLSVFKMWWKTGVKRINGTYPPRRIGRSIAAVVIGVAAAIVLTLGTDFVLHASGVYPPSDQRVPDALLLLATAYRTVYGVAASYLTAWLAPHRPLQHAMIGGALGFVVGVVGTVVTWNGGPAFQPHWYPIALVFLALPQAWLGGWLRVRQLNGAKAL